MDCTLTTLIACLSWANVYVDSGLRFQDAETAYLDRRDAFHSFDPVTGVEESGYTTVATHHSRNPYGRIAIGLEMNLARSLTLRAEAAHDSSVSTGKDRGANSGGIYLRWYPFR